MRFKNILKAFWIIFATILSIISSYVVILNGLLLEEFGMLDIWNLWFLTGMLIFLYAFIGIWSYVSYLRFLRLYYRNKRNKLEKIRKLQSQ